MNKIRNIVFIGVTFIFYTGCGDFKTPQKTSIYEILAQQDAQKSVIEERRLRENLEQMYKGMPFNEDEKYNRQYTKLVNQYKRLENNLTGFKNFLKRYSLVTLFGGINYTMTLNEMGQKIKEKFSEMKKNGLIMSRDEFKKIEKIYFTEKPSTDLTRIWGEEYLKSKINESEYLQGKYDVPKYVIVADNKNRIKVKFDFGIEMFPMIIALENATIYFVKIVGVRSAFSSTVKADLSPIGFDDFSDPGNIIREKNTNMYYVVDTEFKSFKWDIKSEEIRNMLGYTRKRFLYLNKKILGDKFYYIYDIDLSVKTQSR